MIARHGLAARKSLGQHFLLDLNLTRRIARLTSDLEIGTILEVGPGPGGLTRALLLEGARSVVAVERDTRCIGALAELQASFPGRLEVIEADATGLVFPKLGGPPRHIVANLPYNLSTVLLVQWLRDLACEPHCFASMVLMFQKEVARRLVAEPGSGDYGRLSVLTQWLCTARPCFDVRPQAFTPPPRVLSSVVQLLPRAHPLAEARIEALERVTAAAFGQRRKMLRQSLKRLYRNPAPLLESLRIAPSARGESLSIAQFCALARALDEGTDLYDS